MREQLPARPLWTSCGGLESDQTRADGRSVFRYWIERRWSDHGGYALWVMFNPSKATVVSDNGDGALPICIRRTQRLAADLDRPVGAVRVVNLFARRATDVKAEGWPTGRALDDDDWIGPGNDEHIASQSLGAAITIAAWGPSLVRTRAALWRAEAVTRLLVDPWCLGVSPSGEPYYAGPRGAPAAAPLSRFARRDGTQSP